MSDQSNSGAAPDPVGELIDVIFQAGVDRMVEDEVIAVAAMTAAFGAIQMVKDVQVRAAIVGRWQEMAAYLMSQPSKE